MSTPGKSVVVLISLVTLLIVFDSAVECYVGRHAVAHSAAPRRSSMTRSSPATAPPAGEQTSKQHHCSQKHLVHWIIGFVVGSVAGVISGLALKSILKKIRKLIRQRSLYGVTRPVSSVVCDL